MLTNNMMQKIRLTPLKAVPEFLCRRAKSVRNTGKTGFTFIELMAVIVIISTLAMIVMPSFFGRIDEARATAARVQIQNFEQALRLFYLDNGFYPSTEQGLQALIERPPNANRWREGGYLEKRALPDDPWGNPYVYYKHGDDEYEIISFGRDGREGGDGPDADISSSDI